MDWSSEIVSLTPQGVVLFRRPELVALYLTSEVLIALSLLAIAFAILSFARSREDLPKKYRKLTSVLAAFMALCGLVHVASAAVIWFPTYSIEAFLQGTRAILALLMASWLLLLIPIVRKIPSVRQMQSEIATHVESLATLHAARTELAAKVDRTEGELRAAEQDRLLSSTLLSAVIEAVPGPVYAKDSAGRMLLANMATLGVIGRPWSEIAGKRIDEFMQDVRLARSIMADDQEVLNSGTTKESELIVKHPERGTLVFLNTKVPLRNADGEISGFVGMAMDITERKQLARELLHASRQTAMGEMAAALAHELHQPLAAIGLYLDGSTAILDNDGYEGPLTRSLNLAKDQCLRASEIIRRLRSFVLGGGDEKRPEDVRQLVEGACVLALAGVREDGIVATITHHETDMTVLADRVQIEQVIVNLIRNAVDAITGRPNAELNIVTRCDTEDKVTVSVIDNGPGLAEAIASRMFEPFVSTKGVKGMGLGLSICRTIIEGHGGKIWFDQNSGTGAAFHFTLPLSRSAAV